MSYQWSTLSGYVLNKSSVMEEPWRARVPEATENVILVPISVRSLVTVPDPPAVYNHVGLSTRLARKSTWTPNIVDCHEQSDFNQFL